ncbi:MAG: hypothetical protein ABUR63_06415 [Verrucomicrobiota bacterium]
MFSYINTYDDPKTQILRLHNGGTSPVQITSVQLVDNTLAPPTNPPATPGPAGGTLFPQTYNQVSLVAAFNITPSVTTFPATLAAGADLDVTVQFLSTKTTPPDRNFNIGGQSVSAVLVAALADSGCAAAGLYATSFWNNSETPPDLTTTPPKLPSDNWARYEPTFGQIIATLGYKVNIGSPFIMSLNTMQMGIPSPGDLTEEVQVHKFIKFDATMPVELMTVGRFSPPTDAPFGWNTIGSLTGAPGTGGAAGGAGGHAGVGGAGGTPGVAGAAGGGGAAGAGGPALVVTDAEPVGFTPGFATQAANQAATQPPALAGKVVATMVSSPLGVDWNTSNYSEMILPPLKAGSGTTFDPGAAPFGIWAFTNQRSSGGVSSAGTFAPNVANGDYVYSEDSLNIPPDPAHTHRLRVYPLKNRAGVLVPHSYLLGWEEAGNADYNDYIFILKNVAAASTP